METLKTGSLAYFDSFLGLVPCKVVRIAGASGLASTAQNVTVMLTRFSRVIGTSDGKGAAYHAGQVVETDGLHAIPRKAVRFRKTYTRVYPYRVEIGS